METIFDHNPTQQELNRFGLRKPDDINDIKDWYKNDPHPDTINYQLGMLFAMRGDRNKADQYYCKVCNKNMLSTLIQDF